MIGKSVYNLPRLLSGPMPRSIELCLNFQSYNGINGAVMHVTIGSIGDSL